MPWLNNDSDLSDCRRRAGTWTRICTAALLNALKRSEQEYGPYVVYI